MDPNKVLNALEATMNPNLRKEAEAQLDQMHKIAGFSPLLIQLIMSDEVQMAIRQSGAIYLKNMCVQSWHERSDKDGTPVTDVFSIHENDRSVIRTNIVKAIIHAPDIIRSQLTVIIHNIIKHDFPERWPNVVDDINIHLQDESPRSWMGALMALYQLVKTYEFKKPEARTPVISAMKHLLPVMLGMFRNLMEDNSASSALLQKQLLKILYALVQYSLPMELFNEKILDEWVHIMRVIIETPPPPETSEVDELERCELPWWKSKKWAVHFLARVFERYGSPGSVSKEYNEFSEFFLKRYTVSILQVLLKIFDAYRNKEYVSPRVLQQALHFLDQAVSHAHTWKVMKGAYHDLLKDIIFPLMCFTDEDKETWEDDPHEYIRMKFDIFEDFLSPSSAAQHLLHSAASKRKQVLQKTMGFCYSVLTDTTTSPESSRKKDGALHIIGSLADTLLKKKMYKDQLELMLRTHVIPELSSEVGFMRARASWVIQHFSEAKFKKKENIINVVEALKHLLLNDGELPVRVEAAMAIQAFLSEQELAEKHCVQYVRPIMQALLQLVHETENDDLTTIVQKVICLYCEQVIPYAVEITQNLVMVGSCTKEGSATGDAGDNDDKAVTAMGILSTIETVLDMMEEEREITLQLESIVAPLVAHVLKTTNMDYYEEIFSLMYSLTCQAISPHMWEALPLIAEVFEDDAFDYFTDMMPVLHNFCTIDTPTLLSNSKYLEIIFAMCKQILEKETGEDPECHAAKLLEVIILQCRGQIDQCIPLFVEATLARLTREVKTSELRTMCLQVVIAALYYNPSLLIQTLESMRFPNTSETISEQFFRQWINDVDCFLGIHDRRMCVLGLCTLMDLPHRPPCIEELSNRFIPSLIVLFQGLVRAYKASDSSDSSSEDEEEDFETAELASDEDEIDEESTEYLEMLQKKLVTQEKGSDTSSVYSDEETDLENDEDDDASDDEFGDEGETMLEAFPTSMEAESSSVDEFVAFKQVHSSLLARDPQWYNVLMTGLSDEQRKSLEEIYVLADQRHAAAESKKIEKTGGYRFENASVPSSFSFAT
uniref:Importin N-terminal domain-containing protein n=1 Tax=Ciona savignyi TaxID=51511 RepID=H2ZR06_CIOSA